MNHLFFLRELYDNKFRYLKIIVLFSILIFSTLAVIIYINAIVNWSIEPYRSAQYDYKLVALINESVETELYKSPYVEKIAFVLVTDLYLNDRRVTAALIDDLDKANLTIYNSATLKSGKFEEKGVVVSEKLARVSGIRIGDVVTVNPIHSEIPIPLRVTGIFRSQTITGSIVDVILEYPEEYKQYFKKSLPYNAIYGEAYIRFKDGDSEDKKHFAKLINNHINLAISSDQITLRGERVKSMVEYYAREFNTPLMIAVKYGGVFLFFVMVTYEAITYSEFAKRAYQLAFRFSRSFMLLQYLLMTTLVISLSGALATIYGLVFSKFYLRMAQEQIDFKFIAVLLLMAILVSWVVFYIRTRKGAESWR